MLIEKLTCATDEERESIWFGGERTSSEKVVFVAMNERGWEISLFMGEVCINSISSVMMMMPEGRER